VNFNRNTLHSDYQISASQCLRYCHICHWIALERANAKLPGSEMKSRWLVLQQ